MDKEKSATAARTNAVNALLNMKSDEYPNGRTDLAALVKQGVMPGADAIKEAIKKTKPSALQEKLAIFSDPANPYNLTTAQQKLGINNTLGIAVTKSDLQDKLDIYKATISTLKKKLEERADEKKILKVSHEKN